MTDPVYLMHLIPSTRDRCYIFAYNYMKYGFEISPLIIVKVIDKRVDLPDGAGVNDRKKNSTFFLKKQWEKIIVFLSKNSGFLF